MSSFLPPESLVPREQLPLPRPYVGPRTQTERLLEEIWRTVLSMDRVGMDDRYSDLGGDSFLAVTILNRIEQAFRVALPLAIFADSPTIAMLAESIDGASDSPNAA
jgi:acyl carrier protein